MIKKLLLIGMGVIAVTGLVIGGLALLPAQDAAAAEQYRRGGNGTGTGGDYALSGTGEAYGNSGGQSRGRGQGQRGANAGAGMAQEPLSDAEAAGLIAAIEEEYGARALYESVLAQFGDVVPFNAIALSEAQHAEALVRQAEKYGLALPEYSPPSASSFASLAEACQAGAEAEMADAALYDELMAGTGREDLLRVYTNLQNASLNSHLPEFQTCQ